MLRSKKGSAEVVMFLITSIIAVGGVIVAYIQSPKVNVNVNKDNVTVESNCGKNTGTPVTVEDSK